MKCLTLLISILLASNVHAGPINFDSTSLFVDAIADVDGNLDLDSSMLESTPTELLSNLPLSAEAEQNNQAFANAIIDASDGSFFLDATTEAFSENGELSEAIAVTEFSAEFLASAGAYIFALQFDVLNELLFGGLDDLTAANLVAEVIVDGLSIFTGSLTDTGELSHRFRLEDFSSTFVNVFVASEAVAITPGASAFNFSSAELTIRSIPEPSSLLLLSTALIGFHSRRTTQ